MIADIKALTSVINQTLEKDTDLSPSWYVLNQVFIQDRLPNPIAEDILTKIRSLKVVAGEGEVRGLKRDELTKLDGRVCSIISKQVNRSLLDSRDTPYHNLAI